MPRLPSEFREHMERNGGNSPGGAGKLPVLHARVVATFNRKELAMLLDLLRLAEQADPKTKEKFGLTDKKIRVLQFKLWRVFDAT